MRGVGVIWSFFFKRIFRNTCKRIFVYVCFFFLFSCMCVVSMRVCLHVFLCTCVYAWVTCVCVCVCVRACAWSHLLTMYPPPHMTHVSSSSVVCVRGLIFSLSFCRSLLLVSLGPFSPPSLLSRLFFPLPSHSLSH